MPPRPEGCTQTLRPPPYRCSAVHSYTLALRRRAPGLLRESPLAPMAIAEAKLAPVEVPLSSGAANMEHMSELMKLVADSLGNLRSITKVQHAVLDARGGLGVLPLVRIPPFCT